MVDSLIPRGKTMALPRKDPWKGTANGPLVLPAFKQQVDGLSNKGVLAEFIESLGPVTMDDINDLRRSYASFIIQIDRLRGALADVDVSAHTSNNTWSIKESLGHLIDTDRDIWWPRIETLLCEENPSFSDIDQNELLQAHRWQSLPLDEILSQLVRSRWDYAMKLNALSPADFARCGEHSILGEICILRIVQILVAHDEHYLTKIRALIKMQEEPSGTSSA